METSRPLSARSTMRSRDSHSLCSSCHRTWPSSASRLAKTPRPESATVKYTPRTWRESSFQPFASRQYAWIEIYALKDQVDTDDLKKFFECVYQGYSILDCEKVADGKIHLKYSEKDARKFFCEYRCSLGKRINYNNCIWKMKPVDRELMKENPCFNPRKLSHTLKINGIEKNLSEYRLITESCNQMEGRAGPHDNINYNRGTHTATITYTEKEDAEYAYQLYLEKKMAAVGTQVEAEKMFSLCTPTSTLVETENCLLVKGLAKGVTAEDIEDYFREADKGCRVSEVQFGMSVDTALVYFNQMPDYDKVYRYICRVPLKQEMLEVEHVYKSLALEIHCPEEVSLSDVRKFLYKKQFLSEHCHCLSKYKGCVIVTYPSTEEAEDVLSCGNKYGFYGEQIYLKFHHECIGIMSPEHNSKHQASLLSSGKRIRIDEDIFNFIMQNDCYRSSLEREMTSIKTLMEIEEVKHAVTLKSQIPTETKNYAEKILNWERTAQSTVYKFLLQFQNKLFTMSEAAKSSKNLEKKLPKPSDKFDIKFKYDTIHVTGLSSHIEEVSKQVKLILDREDKLVTEVITDLSEPQVDLLKKMKLLEQLENKYKEMEIYIKGKVTIKVKGIDTEVKKAKKEITETVGKMTEHEYDLNKLVQHLHLEIEQMTENLCEQKIAVYKLKKINLCEQKIAVYKLKKFNQLVILAPTSEVGTSLINSIKAAVCEGSVPIPLKASRVAQENSKYWKRFKTKLEKEYRSVNIEWAITHSNIQFAAIGETSDLNSIEKRVSNFLQENKDVALFVPIPEIILKYSEQWLSQKILKEAQEYTVTVSFNRQVSGISICGTQSEIDLFKEKLIIIIKKIKFQKLKVDGHGLPKYFASADGKGILERYSNQKVLVEIESSHNYAYKHDQDYRMELIPEEMVTYRTMQKDHDIDDSRYSLSAKSLQSDTTTNTGAGSHFVTGEEFGSQIGVNCNRPKVEIVVDDITNIQADVIVNSTASGLSLNSCTLSAAILAAAGPQIQEECLQYERQHNGISKSGGGNLQCKEIYHTVCIEYQDHDPTTVQSVHNAVKECLEEANRSEYSSIAIPPIGTGVLKYPSNVILKAILLEVEEFIKSNTKRNLTSILVVTPPSKPDMVQDFSRELKKWESKFYGDLSRADPQNLVPKIDANYLEQHYRSNIQHAPQNTDDQSIVCIGKMYVIIIREQDIDTDSSQMIALTSEQNNQYNLPNKSNIYEFDAPKSNTEFHWKKCILEILDEARKAHVPSLSLPFVESDSFSTDKMADVMAECLNHTTASLTKETKLREIRIRVDSSEAREAVLNVLSKSAKGVTVTFHLFGTNTEHIQEVSDDIERECKKASQKKVLEKESYGTFVRHLSEKDKSAILEYQEYYPVQIFIGNNDITLQGLLVDCDPIRSEIEKMKTAYEVAVQRKYKENVAKIFSGLVQWYYMGNGRRNAFSIEESFAIEGKYKVYTENKANFRVSIPAENSMTLKINFKSMKYEHGTSDNIERETFGGGKSNIPENWTNADNTLEVNVENNTQEYQEVVQHFVSSLRTSRTVYQVTRIQNPLLHKRFEVRKEQMVKENKSKYPDGSGNEKILWHGTAFETVQEINSTGFNRSFCGKNATAYGKGVYFATNTEYSDRDTYSRPDANGFKYIYQCRVLTGEFTQGNRSMIVPPQKPGVKNWFKKTFSSKISYFDSVVDDTQQPQMHVIFYDDQACPQYLIKYK